jgi:dihydroorotate dehydrogenase
MPDWSYQTLLRPVLFALRPETGRDLALGAMGRLARFPGGARVIQLLGHMTPDERLASTRQGIRFASPVGIGCLVDPHLHAARAFAEFGLGFLEIGPVRVADAPPPGAIHRGTDESLHFATPQATIACSEARAKIVATRDVRLPVLARLDPATENEASKLLAALAPLVAGFVVPVSSLPFLRPDAGQMRPIFLAVSALEWANPMHRTACCSAAVSGQISGFLIDSPRAPEGALTLNKASGSANAGLIRELRGAIGSDATIIAGAGIHSPADALDALDAGADLVAIDSGLVFAGPGLPKRISEAVLFKRQNATAAAPSHPSSNAVMRIRAAEQSWFWALLLGLSLFGGGILAMLIALTRVTLPYDEAITGLTRTQLAAINPRLLAFMTHDRVTLAGTMLAVGLQYAALSCFGIRRGLHWALITLTASALVGFFTFFAFLGFGYFDPFHAFVSAILLQFTLLAMHARMPLRDASIPPELHNNEAWRSHQWGQLLFVVHGVVLMVAGSVILTIGMTSVFVREDLEFLNTTAEALNSAHPQLKPLIAHDRASFGGMLLACGVATLLSALWGFQRGQAWLWWSLMIGGNVACLAALAVHMNVGYSSHLHLLPVYGGLAWLWAGGLFSYPFMTGHDDALAEEWQKRLATP